MSKADEIFIATCKDILENGTWDTDREVRPRWEDGTPAHTIKRFGVVNRYNLKEEFPILTIRRTYMKSALDELLWIYQRKSNNIHDLASHVWDQWADETGSIGKAYGYQMGVKYDFPQGRMPQSSLTQASAVTRAPIIHLQTYTAIGILASKSSGVYPASLKLSGVN